MNRLAVGRSARAQQAHKVNNRINWLMPLLDAKFYSGQDRHQGPLNFSKNIVSLVHRGAYCALMVHIAPSWCTRSPNTGVVVYNVPWVHPDTHTTTSDWLYTFDRWWGREKVPAAFWQNHVMLKQAVRSFTGGDRKSTLSGLQICNEIDVTNRILKKREVVVVIQNLLTRVFHTISPDLL